MGGRTAVRIAAATVVLLAAAASSAAARPFPRPPEASPARPPRTTAPTYPTAVPTPPATTHPAAAPGLGLREAPAGGSLRVAVVGDSVAFSLLPTLQAAVEGLGADLGRPAELTWGYVGPGFGLGADVEGFNVVGPAPPPETFASWPFSLGDVVERSDPDLFVVLLGVWDTIGRHVDGRWLAPGSREWDRWYSARVEIAMNLLSRRAATVVWMLMPCTGQPQIDSRLPWVNLALSRPAVRHPRSAGVLPLEPLVCRDGEVLAALPAAGGGEVAVRAIDRIHFDSLRSPFALAAPVRERLRAMLLGPVPRPGPADAADREVAPTGAAS